MSKIVIISVLGTLLVHFSNPISLQETTQPALVLEQPEQNITLLPPLIRICACESTGSATGTPTHFEKNGQVKHGKINPHDIGMCQINSDYHEKAALKMGLDIYKEQDNIKYANHLYSTQGDTPWNWSKHCWGK